MKSVVTLLSVLILTFGISTSSVWAINRALSLDGDGDYVEVPDSTSLHIENQITMEAWVYPTAYEGDKRTIIVKWRAYYFQIEPTSQISITV